MNSALTRLGPSAFAQSVATTELSIPPDSATIAPRLRRTPNTCDRMASAIARTSLPGSMRSTSREKADAPPERRVRLRGMPDSRRIRAACFLRVGFLIAFCKILFDSRDRLGSASTIRQLGRSLADKGDSKRCGACRRDTYVLRLG